MHNHIYMHEDAQFKRFGKMLGTYWDEDSLEALFVGENEDRLRELEKEEGLSSWLKPKKKNKDVLLPLSLILQPSITDALKKGYSSKYGINSPDWAKTATKAGEVNEIFDWKAEDFVRFVGSVVAPIAPKTD